MSIKLGQRSLVISNFLTCDTQQVTTVKRSGFIPCVLYVWRLTRIKSSRLNYTLTTGINVYRNMKLDRLHFSNNKHLLE